MSAQLTMKNRVNKEKRCSLDKCLSLWYNLSTEIENIFSVLFIAFDETLLTQLPHLSPPQNRVNSSRRYSGTYEEPSTSSSLRTPLDGSFLSHSLLGEPVIPSRLVYDDDSSGESSSPIHNGLCSMGFSVGF